MAITKRTEIDLIEILPRIGNIQVRVATVIEEDGVEITRKFHRHVVSPGDDYSGEDIIVRDIASKVHTPEKVRAYRQMLLKNDPGLRLPEDL